MSERAAQSERACGSGQNGFTLMEVLIALAITGMVVSVLMTSVFYGAKVQSAIRQELVDREQSLRAKAWFTDMLGGCLPAETVAGGRLVGNSLELACDSTMPVQGRQVLAVQRIQLSLVVQPERAARLVYRRPGAAMEPVTLAELPGSQAQWVYVGSDGQEQAKWPVNFNDPQTLPRRIMLRVKDASATGNTAEWLVSLRATPWLDPTAKLPPGFGLTP